MDSSSFVSFIHSLVKHRSFHNSALEKGLLKNVRWKTHMIGIQIRLYKFDDASALYEAARESIPEVYPWLPWCHPEYTLEESEKWLADQVQKEQEEIEFEFAILDSDGFYLGGCGINGIDWKQKIANLGYWIGSSAMGQGIAVKAVELLSTWGFQKLI